MMKLEVNKLGRPYHKIKTIFMDKRDHLDGKLGIYFLKKFRVNVSLKSLAFEMDVWHKQAQIFSSSIGNIAIVMERTLVLNVLNDYYGLNKENQEAVSVQDTPVTKTEERLKAKLAAELATLITADGLFVEELNLQPDNASLLTSWSYRIDFLLDGYEGTFSLLLDSAHVDRLLATLPGKSGAKLTAQENPAAHGSFLALPVRLTGHLVSVSMRVAELMQLKTGDIIPVSLKPRVPLYIGQQPLMTAAIAEDNGKLFFSEFTEPGSEKTHE